MSILRTFLVILITCLSSGSQAQEEELRNRLPSMTVGATIIRELVPDIAILRLSISSEKTTASEAAEETARASQSVIAEINAQGLSPRDLKTNITISPAYDEQRNAQRQPVSRKLRGYVARNSLSIRIYDTARAAVLARSLIDRGANVFEGIDFEISERKKQREILEVQAVQEAVRKAKLYAEAAGVRLGRVLNINPDPSSLNDARADLPRRVATGAEVVKTVIPVEPGVIELTGQAYVAWEILP